MSFRYNTNNKKKKYVTVKNTKYRIKSNMFAHALYCSFDINVSSFLTLPKEANT
jgi:hypothetical protein